MIVVLGSNGYLGSSYASYFREKNISFTSYKRPKHGDLLGKDNLYNFLKEVKPSFLINAAGYTGKPNVDACETDKEATYAGNVTLPMIVGEVCESLKVPWGHVSSGCIYNGYEKDYTEEDEPNFSFDNPPCSYYSGTKAEAEKLMKDAYSNYYVWRLRIPFDEFPNKRNYLNKILNYDTLLNVKNSVSHKRDFVKASLDLWYKRCDFGTYNITNTGNITAAEVLSLLKEKYTNGLEDKHWRLIGNIDEFYQAIGPVTPRSNCALSNQKLLDSGIKIRNVNIAMASAIDNYTMV